MGKFIVIEGLDGAGTTTQTQLVKQAIIDLGKTVLVTKEPYEGPFHDLIRKIISGDPEYQKYKSSLLWLYMADRRYHLDSLILPALEKYDFVISDRYIQSSMAYQADSNADVVDIFHAHSCGGLNVKPDLTIYLKTPVEVCLDRLVGRSQVEIFENRECLKKVSANYDQAMDYLKVVYFWDIFEIDGVQNQTLIFKSIVDRLIY